jgi:transcriptional regulator with XRE-family HTH domain
MTNGQLVLARAPRLRMLLNMTRAFKSTEASRVWLAERAGVDVETVQRWERGEERIPETIVCMLAELFGVSDTFLLGIEEPRDW